jgi:phenylacetate-CoA ligase
VRAAARVASLVRFALRYPAVSRAEITEFQSRRLRRLIAHARAAVPYYRRLLDAHGVRPEDVRSLDELGRLPTTTKRDIQALPAAEVVARGFRPERLVHHRTSGSSGEPLTIRRTWLEERLYGVFRLRALRGYGGRLRDRRAAIGIVRARDPRDRDDLQRVARRLGLLPRTDVDCLLPPADILAALRRLAPDVVSGTPAVLAEVAPLVSEQDRRVLQPRFLTIGGEVLTPLMRAQIARAFRAPVYELYGAHEVSLIAWQCPRSEDLHLCEDNVIAEILVDGRPARPGEAGEIVLTRLDAYAMPFIRYRLGDVVTRGGDACACGAPFATIRAVQGRMLDYFPLPGARVIHPYDLVLTILPRTAAWMRQYQLIQEREDRIVLLVAPLAPPGPGDVAALERAVRQRLGEGVEFGVELVDEIRIERNGKFRVSRSLVKSAYEPA